MSIDTQQSPLVILCLDAGDSELIQRWVREGYLPTIASLMNRGTWGVMGGPDLVTEHGIWVSLFSGLSRARHNYYDFRQLDPGTYNLVPMTAKKADCLPFWSQLRATKKKIAILDIQDIFPVPGINGIQLSNWATHEPLFETSADPAELLTEAKNVFGSQMHMEVIWDGNFEQDRKVYRKLLERIRKKGILYRHLLKKDRFDLVVVSFAESHTGGHQLWKHRPNAPHPLPEGELTHGIRNLYQRIDEEFKLILEQLPSTSNVFLVTSAGLEDHFATSGLVEAICRKLGYQLTPEAGPFSWNPLIARRIIPQSIRIAISSHFPRITRERLLADQFRGSTDWSKTTAFSLPSFYAGNVRVNLRGREPRGVIAPAEYKELLERLKADFMQVVDPQTREPAVRWLPTSEELFGVAGHPYLPDLFVKWKPHDHYLGQLHHPKAVIEHRAELIRDSGHSDIGFIVAAGPNISNRGGSGNIALLDLVPTFLALLNEPVPEMLPGHTLSLLEPKPELGWNSREDD